MKLPVSTKTLERFISENAPSILTSVGVVGVVGTAVLMYKAATKSTEKLYEVDTVAQVNGEPPLTTKRIVKLTWVNYIPPVGCAAVTIGAIVFANHLNTKRIAALTAAYAISEKKLSEYKDKVIETIGEKKEQALRDDLAQDGVKKNPPGPNNTVLVIGKGDVLCQDTFSGQYFRSSMDTIKKAENDTNHDIIHCQYATLTDFYRRLGLPPTDMSDELGWSFDDLIKLEISAVVAHDDEPCLAVSFQNHPMAGYRKVH
jgi:hypothetical protein